jgi:hypothetical protein
MRRPGGEAEAVSASASGNYAAVDPAAVLSTEGVEMGQGWGGDVSGVELRAHRAEGDGRAGGGGHDGRRRGAGSRMVWMREARDGVDGRALD